jgi:hypothetical protein
MSGPALAVGATLETRIDIVSLVEAPSSSVTVKTAV